MAVKTVTMKVQSDVVTDGVLTVHSSSYHSQSLDAVLSNEEIWAYGSRQLVEGQVTDSGGRGTTGERDGEGARYEGEKNRERDSFEAPGETCWRNTDGA